jgi:hypothetical protein
MLCIQENEKQEQDFWLAFDKRGFLSLGTVRTVRTLKMLPSVCQTIAEYVQCVAACIDFIIVILHLLQTWISQAKQVHMVFANQAKV